MSDQEFIPRGDQVYVLGLDLGQVNDFTALCINQVIERPDGMKEHRARHLERWRGEKYPVIVRAIGERIGLLLGGPDRRPSYEQRYYPLKRPSVALVIDHTGVGRPVSDMFEEEAYDCGLAKVTITGGSEVTQAPDDRTEYRVPKRILASTMQVLLQTERFKVQKDLPLAETLRSEMTNFKVKINLLGHESYGAGDDWREKNHDDLVLAAALACWAGESGVGMPFEWSTVDGRPIDEWMRAAGVVPAWWGR